MYVDLYFFIFLNFIEHLLYDWVWGTNVIMRFYQYFLQRDLSLVEETVKSPGVK